MSGFDDVILTFRPFGEAADAFVLTEGMKFIASAGQKFVGIGLMADIPDQFVVGRIKDIVQGNGQFDHARGLVPDGRRFPQRSG